VRFGLCRPAKFYFLSVMPQVSHKTIVAHRDKIFRPRETGDRSSPARF
jgi:hypothetical protein